MAEKDETGIIRYSPEELERIPPYEVRAGENGGGLGLTGASAGTLLGATAGAGFGPAGALVGGIAGTAVGGAAGRHRRRTR